MVDFPAFAATLCISLKFAKVTIANFAVSFEMLTLYFTAAVGLVMNVVMVMSFPETFKRAYINESALILNSAVHHSLQTKALRCFSVRPYFFCVYEGLMSSLTLHYYY